MPVMARKGRSDSASRVRHRGNDTREVELPPPPDAVPGPGKPKMKRGNLRIKLNVEWPEGLLGRRGAMLKTEVASLLGQ